jgi:hypothetical protein
MSAWDREFCGVVEQALEQRLSGQLSPGERVRVTGESGDDLCATFTIEGGSSGERLLLASRAPVGKAGFDEARDLILDALDLILLEYLESGRSVRFSGVWEARELRGRTVQFKGERTFPDLDARASALLSLE